MSPGYISKQITRVKLRGRVIFTRPTRFVVFATARSGSTMLMTMLDSHPRVRTNGEYFTESRVRAPDFECVNARDMFCGAMRRSGFEKAVGAKLLYHHLQPEHGRNYKISGYEEFLEYLVREEAIRVIHLTRENILRSVVSVFVAQEDGQWHRTKDQPRTSTEIHVDPAKALKWVRDIQVWEQETRDRFSKHRMLELSYENLLADVSGHSQSIFDFLKVDVCDVAPSTRKQGRSMQETVVNFSELKAFFQGTEFEWMVEE